MGSCVYEWKKQRLLYLQVVGVIHEMFIVDGEEHTGVSEMLIATG